MKWVVALVIVLLSAFLWRVRGGLKINGKKLPANKIWYAVFFAVYGCIYYSPDVQMFVLAFADCYMSYQLYGWGAYIGGLMDGLPFNRSMDAECELIDDLLYPCRITFGKWSTKIFNLLFGWLGWKVEEDKTYWLKDYGRAFGFCGTCLTGLIISILWGLYLNSIAVAISGLGMGICYYLGYLLNKVIPEQKDGWGYGEWIDGLYKGAVLAWVLLW